MKESHLAEILNYRFIKTLVRSSKHDVPSGIINAVVKLGIFQFLTIDTDGLILRGFVKEILLLPSPRNIYEQKN
jgi:hypothetical protein